MEQVEVEIAPLLYEKWLQLATILERRDSGNEKAQSLIIDQEQNVILEENTTTYGFGGNEALEEALLFIEERLNILTEPHIYNGLPHSGHPLPQVSLPPDCDRLPEMLIDFMGWSSFLAPVELIFSPNWFCSIKYNHRVVFEAAYCAEAIAYFCDEMKNL